MNKWIEKKLIWKDKKLQQEVKIAAENVSLDDEIGEQEDAP